MISPLCAVLQPARRGICVNGPKPVVYNVGNKKNVTIIKTRVHFVV